MPKFAIGIVAVLVIPVLAIFALAPHSQVMQRAVFSIRRTNAFAASLHGRDKRCSIADVWAAGSGKLFRVKDRIHDVKKVVGGELNLILVATPEGRFWIPAPDIGTLAETLAEGELEVFSHDVRPGDVVLDCGANVGVCTRRALGKGAGMVVEIEPAPEALVCLRRNSEREIRQGRVVG